MLWLVPGMASRRSAARSRCTGRASRCRRAGSPTTRGRGTPGSDVADHAAAGVPAGVDAEEHLAGLGVAHGHAVRGQRGALVHGEDLQAGPVRVDVGDVHGVAVAEPGRRPGRGAALGQGGERAVQQAAVVVDGGGAVDDLLLAVAVHVGGAERVEALRGERAELRVGAVAAVRAVVERVGHRRPAAVDVPALAQPAAVPVVGDQRGPGVVAAGEHRRRTLAVEVGDAGQEPVDPVARLDPGHRVVAPHQAVVVPAGLVAGPSAARGRSGPSKTVRYSGPSTMKPSNARSTLRVLRAGA